jgi:hypothetical protein
VSRARLDISETGPIAGWLVPSMALLLYSISTIAKIFLFALGILGI